MVKIFPRELTHRYVSAERQIVYFYEKLRLGSFIRKKCLTVTTHFNLRSHKSRYLVAALPFTYGIS